MKYRKYILVFYFMCIFMLLNYEKSQDIDYLAGSFSDMLIDISGNIPCLFLHIPFWGALIIDSHSTDLNPLRVIMHRSPVHIIIDQQKRILIWALCMTVNAYAATAVFALSNGCSLDADYDLMIIFVLFYVIRFYIWANVILIFKWYFNSFAAGLLVDLIMGFCDVVSRALPTDIKIGFIGRTFNIEHGLWNMDKMSGKLLIFTAIVSVIVILYLFIAEKREYINE